MKKPLAFSVMLISCAPAYALEYSLGPVDLSWINRLSLGAAWRVEERDPQLIGKRNLDPDLCREDNCQSLSGDPGPNQALVDAPGGFLAHNMDDGNLNYDQGDMVAGLIKWTSDLRGNWGDLVLKARMIGFYDFVNSDFEDRHPNTTFQPARTPRDAQVEKLVGHAIELHDLMLSWPFELGENFYELAVGQQKIRWGESNLIVLNSLNEINPPDGRRLHQPGFQVNELFQPVPMISLSGDLNPDLGLGFQAFYQFGWRPVIADPGGSFYGDIDPLHKDDTYATLGIGNQAEDPERQARIANQAARLLTDTSFTGHFLPDREPEDGGQYGFKLSWFSDFLLPGTEYGFYAMNYHARLPSLSLNAADRSCLRDAAANNYAAYLAACEGFPVAGGREPLPVETLAAFFEYPEDIQLYGISFNTNLGKWSVAGEYSFRPNVPVQVQSVDLIWAGLQPAFPEDDIVFGTAEFTGDASIDDLLALGLDPALAQGGAGFPITVPGARNAIPDFIETRYRGHDVQAFQYIPGYERMAVDQLVMNGIRILGSSHPVASLIGSEQIIIMLEAGVTHIWDMPGIEQLQFEGGSPNASHRAGGADGTGMPNGQPDARRQNPTQQTEAFPTEFSWGYRLLTQMQYNDVLGLATLKPLLVIAHDLGGTTPKPFQNFIEDRLDAAIALEVLVGQRWSAKLQYNLHIGTRHYARRDRDNIAIDLNYVF